MRLLHAGHRDEPVRRLSRWCAPHRGQPQRPACRAIFAAAPAIALILTAGLAACDGAPTDRFAATAAERSAAIAALAEPAGLLVGDESRFFAAPADIPSLAELYGRFPDATLVGRATDVGLWVTKQLRDLGRVISLGRVVGLDAIGEADDGALSLGAGVDACRGSAAARGGAPIRPRRNDASLRLDAGAGQRHRRRQHRQRIADWRSRAGADRAGLPGCAAEGRGAALAAAGGFLSRLLGKQDRGPGEFVVAVSQAPRLAEGQHYCALKVSNASTRIFRPATMGLRFDLEGRRIANARIAFGGMAATPKRAANVEKALAGAEPRPTGELARGARRTLVGFHAIRPTSARAQPIASRWPRT